MYFLTFKQYKGRVLANTIPTDKHKKVVKSTYPSVRVSGVSFLTRASVVAGVVVTQ